MNVINVKDSMYPQDVEDDKIGKEIVDAAFYVHTALGPGLLESVYETCLVSELKYRGLNVISQTPVPVLFRDRNIEAGFRLDILVEGSVIIEIKACERLLPVHDAQLLTYMKLMNKRLGYLINFNSVLIKDGIKRVVKWK